MEPPSTQPLLHQAPPRRPAGLSTSLLGIITLVTVGFALYVTRPVVLPLVIAWLLFYVLSPVLSFLKRHRVSNALAVLAVVFLMLALVYLGGRFFFDRVNEFVAEYSTYQAKFLELVRNLTEKLDLKPGSLGEFRWTNAIGMRLAGLAGSFVTFLGKTVLVMIFLVFLLLSQGQLERKIHYAFSEQRAGKVSRAIEEISRQIGRYLTIKLLVSLSTGVIMWFALKLIGVDFAVTWGAFAFFLNFIPNVGSIIACVPPILVALLQNYPNAWPCLLTAIVLGAIQTAFGNFIEPKLQGDRLKLSPVVVLFSLVFWGWLWGVVGMLVSVPIAAAIKITCQNVEPLRPISVFMGSNPPRKG